MCQRMMPKLVVLHSCEKLKFLEINLFWKKKSFQLICVDTIFKTVSRCFLRINQSQDILTFGDFMVSKKLFFTVKLPIKHKQQTIKKTAQLSPKSTHEVSAKQD